VPERSNFLDGDAPAADKVAAFLTRALDATGSNAQDVGAALVPWICDALLSNHSIKAYGRDFMDFIRHMQAQGVTPLEVTADHVKLYKRALHEAGMTTATIARRQSESGHDHRCLVARAQRWGMSPSRGRASEVPVASLGARYGPCVHEPRRASPATSRQR
jgi:hypothetical protein